MSISLLSVFFRYVRPLTTFAAKFTPFQLTLLLGVIFPALTAKAIVLGSVLVELFASAYVRTSDGAKFLLALGERCIADWA